MPRLTKSLVLSGLQCQKLLWWLVHEPPPDTEPDLPAEERLAVGRRVGRIARDYVPGGELVSHRFDTADARLAATRRAIAAGTGILYEPSFLAGDVFVAADILVRDATGCVLIEVKSTTRAKDEHAADLAVQAHVLRANGVPVTRMEVMHLNRECRFPDLTNLFTRTDVTEAVEALVPAVPAWLAENARTLGAELPDVAIGAHCRKPRDCAFLDRCWEAVPPDHVSTIHGLTGRQKELLVERGWTRIRDLPADTDLPAIAARQVRAVRRGVRIVESSLGDALAGLEGPLAFLDFETINPAIPVWPGCRPYDQIPVQFSCHVEQPEGTLAHIPCLVDGAGDTRAEIAHKLVAACAGARHIVAYYMSFERCGVQHLAAAVPELAPELADIERRIVDLWPIVRNHVYDPAFGGSFSIKDVLPVLVPGLGYDDLAIRDGSSASVLLGELVLDRDITDIRRAQLRRDLLQYCERDTLAMVELLKALREMAGPQDPQLSLL